MIYVPNLDYECYVVQSEEVIRAYEQVPTNNTTIEYRDYYFNSNYLYKDGQQTFSNYTTLPVCLDSSELTTDFYYRNDFADILIIFFVISIFAFYLPIKLLQRFTRRW